MTEKTVQVCVLTREHLPAAAELEKLCFSEPWSEKALELLLGDMGVGAVCLENGHAVAYGGMLLAPDEGQITNIATHPSHRRRGYGRAVTEALLEMALKKQLEQVSLEVRVSNESAILLYEKLGFVKAGQRRNFYRAPKEDALVMIKRFGKEREDSPAEA